MAQKVEADGYATEVVAGVEIQRLVKAGANIPDHWKIAHAAAPDPNKEKSNEAPKRSKKPES